MATAAKMEPIKDGEYTEAQVSELLDIPAATLRQWRKRRRDGRDVGPAFYQAYKGAAVVYRAEDLREFRAGYRV